MLLRVRSPDQQARLEIDQTASLTMLFAKIREAMELPAEFAISLNPTGKQQLKPSKATLASLGLQHGTQVYVSYQRDLTPSVPAASENAAAGNAPSSLPTQLVPSAIGQSEPIDELIEKQDGLIKRKRDARLHGDLGMCDYCRPLEPYDQRYLEQNKIKHMPFHAYLRKLTNSTTHSVSSSHFVPPLDEPSFALKQPCTTGHPPYPEGICSKCQPSAITLQPQDFRMVDHVEFETPALIEGLLSYWRESGLQRFGWLYGRYEMYSEVSLGVKAVVCAIYEPPQQGHTDGIQIAIPGVPESQSVEHGNKVEEEEARVDKVAQMCGLERVGMIYTDLQDDGTGTGAVVTKRHQDSFFLSSGELVFAAQQQLKHPLKTKFSFTGQFGSRFITSIISGNQEGGIEISAYQVSNIGMGMVRDGIVEASVDPGTLLVKESTNKQYIPETFYKYKNEYGVIVQNHARDKGFPVDYLLVTLTHGFPQNPNPTFTSPKPFPIENRYPPLPPQVDGALLKKHLALADKQALLSDFHLLAYIASLAILSERELHQACNVAVGKIKDPKEVELLEQTDGWMTMDAILATENTSFKDKPATPSKSTPSQRSTWACRHCTFENTRPGDCEVCGLPRD